MKTHVLIGVLGLYRCDRCAPWSGQRCRCHPPHGSWKGTLHVHRYCISVCSCACVYTCNCVYVYACVHVCMLVCACVCMCACFDCHAPFRGWHPPTASRITYMYICTYVSGVYICSFPTIKTVQTPCACVLDQPCLCCTK